MILLALSNGRILRRCGSLGLTGHTGFRDQIYGLDSVNLSKIGCWQGGTLFSRRHKHTGPNAGDNGTSDGHTGPEEGSKNPYFKDPRKVVNYLDYNAKYMGSSGANPGYFSNIYSKNRKGALYGRFGAGSEAEDSTGYGLVVLFVAMFGISFACVPLYEYFCQKTGYLGTTKRTKTYPLPPDGEGLRKFEIDFVTHSNLNWEFKPCQKKVIVRPGETTLSFYTAKNLTDKPIIGIAAYHVIPDEAGLYFNKIQCFCFEEQLLNPGEEVDLPVLFFLDPDIVKDKKLHGVDKITLSYIFFEANSEIPPEYTVLFK